MELKPQDVLVLLKQVSTPQRVWTYATLGDALHLSASQVHRSVTRCRKAGLATSRARGEWHVVRTALREFSEHGLRYAFPAEMGPPSRGIPTAFGAPPLNVEINSLPNEAPVWPHSKGNARGPSLSPLCRQAPDAALADPKLYELLALLDAMRTGRSREREIAARLFKARLGFDDAT